MSEFWTTNGAYRAIEYASEAELESVILDIQTRLFGPHRVYLDVKRKIRRKGG